MRKFLAVAAVAAALALTGCSVTAHSTISADESNGADSTEFSTLENGQIRFSTYETGVENVLVLVDNKTSVRYLVTATGTCPLFNGNGTLQLY